MREDDWIAMSYALGKAEEDRGRYPDAFAATAADWRRLGREYLDRTARWRGERPRFTDKMPENWKHAGVLRAMRRDALETDWSCDRQQFYQLPHFACDLRDICLYIRT